MAKTLSFLEREKLRIAQEQLAKQRAAQQTSGPMSFEQKAKQIKDAAYADALRAYIGTATYPASGQDSLVGDVFAYAAQGDQQRNQLAESLQTGVGVKPQQGNINDWNEDAARRAVISNDAYIKALRDSGLFDREEYATDQQMVGMVGSNYLQSQIAAINEKLNNSRDKDKARVNWQNWSDLQNRMGEMTEYNAPQFWAYADYLLGDQTMPWDFNRYNAAWDNMDDETFSREQDRLRTQFEELDLPALATQDSGYKSKTSAYQEQLATVQKELDRRTTQDELERMAKSDPNFAALAEYQGEQLQQGVNDERMFNSPYFFANNADVERSMFTSAAYKTHVNYATRDVETYVSPYLEKGYDFLTPDELAVYNYYYHKDQAKAAQYLETLQGTLLSRRASVNTSFWETLATDDRTAAIAYLSARGANLLNANKAIEQFASAMTGSDDPNAAEFDYLNMASAVTGAQLQEVGELGGPEVFGKTLGQHLYSGITSAVDNTARLMFGGKMSLALAGLQSASSSLYENAGREDMSGAAKITQALLTSGLEVGTEKIGLDALFDMGQASAAKYLTKAIGSELGEESVNYFGEYGVELAVAWLFGHEAEIRSAEELAKGYGETVLNTLISSGVMSGPGAVATGSNTRATGKNTRTQGDAGNLVKIGLNMDETSKSGKIAREMDAKQKKGRAYSNYDLGRLTMAIEEETSAELAEAPNKVMDNAIEERLLELGETEQNAKALAPVIRQTTRGQKPTIKQRAAMKWTDNAEQVVKELTRETAEEDSGRAGNAWVTGLQGKTFDAVAEGGAKLRTAYEATGKVKKQEAKDEVKTATEEAVTKAVGKASAKVRVTKSDKAPLPTALEMTVNADGTETAGNATRFVEQDGEVKLEVQTENGAQAVTLDQITGADGEGIAAIAAWVDESNGGAEGTHQMSAQEASTMLQVYQTEGGDAGTFIKGFEDAYLAGYSGVEAAAQGISEQAAQIAWEQGRAEAQADEKTRVERASRARETSEGTVAWLGKAQSNAQVTGKGDAGALTAAVENMTESQRTTVEVVQAFAETFKTNVVLFESEAENIQQLQNGSYNSDTNTIYIDVNAGAFTKADLQTMRSNGTLGYAMMKTLGHEVTHYLEANSPKAYAAYKAAVKQELKNQGEDWATLVRGKIQQAHLDGRKMTYAGAEAEVIADASEYMLQNSKFVNSIETGTKGTVKRIVQNFMRKLNDVFTKLTMGNRESRALRREIGGVMQYTGNLQKLWDAAMDETLGRSTTEGNQSVDTAEMVEDTVMEAETEEVTDTEVEETETPEEIAAEEIYQEPAGVNEERSLLDVIEQPTAQEIRQEVKATQQKATPDFIKGLSQRFGLNIQVAENRPQLLAAYDQKTGTILIGKNASTGEVLYKALAMEMFRSVEGTKYAIDLRNALWHAAYKGDFAAYAADTRAVADMLNRKFDNYGKRKLNAESALVQREMNARMAAQVLGNADSLNNLMETERPTLIRKIRNALRSFVNKLRGIKSPAVTPIERAAQIMTEAMDERARTKGKRVKQPANFGMQNRQSITAAITMMGEDVALGMDAAAENVQYSIRKLQDGTQYVEVDTDQQIFDNIPPSEYAKAARNYIRDHFRNTVIGDKVRAYVRRESENEYTMPAKKNIPPALYEGKMKAATELDNLLNASEFIGHEDDDGRHPDAVRGWDKYRTVFGVDGRFFEGTVALKKISKGDVFYDVTKIKDITGPMRAKYSDELQYPGQGDILTDSVHDAREIVNGNIQQSSRAQVNSETAAEAYERYRQASMNLNDIRKKQKELKDSDEMKAVYELMEQNAAAGAEAYKNLLDKHGLNVSVRELQTQERELYKKWEELRDRELAVEEEAEIEKSGKTEAEYRRDKAVKEFGYTPYFYDAGYLVPNGKMLNFSGEKNRHYGSRGQDHRAISTVYANKSGSEAMVAFMHGGNIRLMPESPGLDIASSVEPTTQQYAAIRKFVREYGDDEYLNIDFTNEKGYVVGSLEYEGRIYPERVVNDIKHYYATGEIREQGISAFQYSPRTPSDTLTIREYLGEMKPTARMNETEKILLKRYQDQLKVLREKEALVAEQDEIIKTAPVNSDDLTMAKNRRNIYRAQANRAARALSEAERADGFARLMATSQEVVNRYLLGSAGSVADAADALDEEVSGLTRQLKAVEADVTRTASAQRTAFARGLFDQKTLNSAAQKLKDTYGSRMAVKSIADRLALVYGEIYADSGAKGAKRFAEAAKDLATDILAGHKYRYKSEILPMLPEKMGTISLTETDLQEIRNAGMTVSEYKRGLSPWVKVSDGASDLSSYATNAAYNGDGVLLAVLGDETEGNLAMNLYNIIQQEKAQEQEIGVEGRSEGEMITAVMADIAGSDMPLSTNSKTAEYLRSEMKKFAGESTLAAQNIEQAIMNAKKATGKATDVWRAAAKEVETAKAAVEYYRKLEEQRRLTELKEQKQAITEELKSENAKKLMEQVKAQREEYRTREQKAREYRKTREEADKLRRKVGRDVKRLNTLRVRETDQKHVPQELQHVADAVMRTFTDSGLSRLAFSAEKTASLQRTYQILGELESDFAYYWDDEIQADIDNLVSLSEAYSALRNREGDAPSYLSLEGVELEVEILQGVDNIVSNVMHMIDTANRNFLAGRQESFESYANKTGEKLVKRKDAKVLKGAAGKIQTMLDETLRTGNVTPVYFFEHLQNDELKQVFDQVRKGQSNYAKIVAEGKAFVENAKTHYNYGTWVADGKLMMKTGKGHEIELTREEAAELYAIHKREQANKLYQTVHLLKGGFQYRNIAEKGAGAYQATDKPHQLDAADMAKISAWLTDEQKAYADELVGYLSTTMADYGNAASMEMYGYKKFTESYYIPFKTVADQRFQRGDEGPQGENAGTGRVKNAGFTKKLQNKANQPLVIGGITDTVADHIHKMAAYSAMVQPIEDMKRLLNHKVMEEDGTVNTIRALIGQKYGKATENYLTQLLKDLNGATQSDNRASDLTNRLISAFKRGAVLASASVVLQQPTAMARAMAYISPKYFAQNPFYRPSKGTWEEMMKYAGTAVIKDMGKFDVGMGLTATQYIGDEKLAIFETYRRLKADSKTKAGKAAYDRFMERLTAAPGIADQWTWGIIWKAVKAEQAALHPEMDVNGEAFLQMCGARFDDVVDHTQVYDSVITRSNLMRSSNQLHKMATSFMSEPTLSLNMLYDAMVGKHSKGKRGAIIGGVVASQVLAGAMAALAQAWNDDDDKRNWAEKYVDRAVANIFDNMNPLGMIPYVSDVISMFQGYDVERPDMTVIADLMDYTKTFMKAFEDGGAPSWKQIENFAGTWANLLGLPLKNISREVRRLRNAVQQTDWSEPNMTNVGFVAAENVSIFGVYSPWGGEKKDYYNRMITAMQKGDEKLVEDYRTYLLDSKMVEPDKLTTGLRDAYKERYQAGGIEKDDAISFMVENGLAKDQKSAFEHVDKWEEGGENHSAYKSIREDIWRNDFAAVTEGIRELEANGWTPQQIYNALHADVDEHYMLGSMTQAQYKNWYNTHGVAAGKQQRDENDWYWEFKKLDWGKAHGGSTEGYDAYEDMYKAVEAGGSGLSKTIKEYQSHGKTREQLNTALNNYYKQKLIDLWKAGKRKEFANLQAQVLTAYQVLGYDRDQKLKTIQGWLK